MKNLLNVYFKLETKLDMEGMLKEQIYLSYYNQLTDFKNEMFFLDNEEFIHFLDDYQLNQAELTKDFIMLYDKNLDFYRIWTNQDNLETILNYFLHETSYRQFLI